jgi:enamine deaminase RidA (YjgF/YER057c/UK114 family)
MAVDETGGLARAVRLDPGRPYFGSPSALQADYLLSQAERICAKAGTSLANVVRAQHFHTDLAGFDGAWQAWQKHLPGRHIPFSAIEVPALAVPGAVLMLDLWVHVP